jgi:hypothetical protein
LSIGGDGNPLLSSKPDQVTVAESDVGGFSQPTSIIKFNNDDGFYITSDGDGTPLVSFKDTAAGGGSGTVTSVTFSETESGGFTKSDTVAPVIRFDSNNFYISVSGGDGEPIVSKKEVPLATLKITAAHTVGTGGGGGGRTLSWDVATEDIGSWVNLGSDATIFTVPTGVNRVICSFNLEWTANATGIRVAEVRKNTTALDPAPAIVYNGNDTDEVQTMTTYPIPVVAGDTLDVFTFQDSGGDLDIIASNDRTWFSVYQLD